MNFEQPQTQKIEVDENTKEIVLGELDRIDEILNSILKGDENYAYADTVDSMETIDSVLSENPLYQASLGIRKEASKNIIQGNPDEKNEGIRQAITWVNNMKNLL